MTAAETCWTILEEAGMPGADHDNSSTTVIAKGQDVATLINLFTVEPDRQRELVELLSDVTEQTMRHQPGFVSANIHASSDGTRVVNYAQWETAADVETMLQNPAAREHMGQAAGIATSFDPNLYEIASIHRREE